MGKQRTEAAVIDRFEDEDVAVLLVGEDEEERVVDRSFLPPDATEGTWLQVRFVNDQLVWAMIDRERTDAVRRRIASKMDRLRRRGSSGSVDAVD